MSSSSSHPTQTKEYALRACRCGHIEEVTQLLDSGCDVNARSPENGATLLMIATKGGHKALVDLLLSRKAGVNDVDFSGHTALMWACIYGRFECFKSLLYSWTADLDKTNISGSTALIMATAYLSKGGAHNLQYIKLLLEQDADVNLKNDMGMSAIMYCMYSAGLGLETLKVLQDGGADLHVLNDDGESLLMLAVRQRHVDILQYLLANTDIDIHLVNTTLDNALIIALKLVKDNSQLVDILLQAGCNPNSKSGCGRSALNIAAACSFENTRLLLSYGAEPKLSLMYISRKGVSKDLCLSLKSCGQIFSPVDVAVMNGEFSIAVFLLKLVGCRPYSLFESYSSLPLNQRSETSQNLERAINEMIKMAQRCQGWIDAVRRTITCSKPLKLMCAAVISQMAGNTSRKRKHLELSGLPPSLVKFIMFDVDEEDFVL